MKFQYLGTSAAEGVPALYCDCKNCMKARALGGKNLRSRSQAVIDDTILIDFPPDTYLHYYVHNFPLPKIKHIFVTHTHADHLQLDDIVMRKTGLANLSDPSPLNFYGSPDVSKTITQKKVNHEMPDSDILIHTLKPYETYEVEGYSITPLPAVHGGYDISGKNGNKNSQFIPYTYIIEKDGKSMLYHHDSDFYADETFEFLVKRNKPFNFVSIDCTNGIDKKKSIGHLGLDEAIIIRDEFIKNGIANKNTIFAYKCFILPALPADL